MGGREAFFFFFIYSLVYWLYFEVDNYAASSGWEGREAFFFFFIYSLVYWLYFEVGKYAASSGWEGREAFFFFSFILWCIGCISKSVITRLPVGGREGSIFFFFIYSLVYLLYFDVDI